MYDATLNGRELQSCLYGSSMDLALADDLFERAASIEQGYPNSYGVYGSAGSLAAVVSAMTPGYTEASFDPGLFKG